MPHPIARLSASALSHHGLSLAAFITNTAESNYRFTQVAMQMHSEQKHCHFPCPCEHLVKAGDRHCSAPLCEKHTPRLCGTPRASPYDALAPVSLTRAAWM